MMGKSFCAGISAGEITKRLSPLSRVERPVPPPMATTRRPRSRAAFSNEGNTAVLVSIENVPESGYRRLFFAEIAVRRRLVRRRDRGKVIP